MGFSNYEAANTLSKAGRPIIAQRLRLTYAGSYNENTIQPLLRTAYRGAEIVQSV